MIPISFRRGRGLERVRKQDDKYAHLPSVFEFELTCFDLDSIVNSVRIGHAKIQLGLARGKQLHDRRQDIAARDARRDMERQLADLHTGRR